MNINKIQVGSQQPSFDGFRLNKNGAQRLARDFVKNPELEKDFMQNLAEPLMKYETDVFFNGRFVCYKHPVSKFFISMFKVMQDKYIVEHLGGCLMFSKVEFMPPQGKKLNQTHSFTTTPYQEIEAVKNIVEILEDTKPSFSQWISRTENPSDENIQEAIARKTQELMERFPLYGFMKKG